MADSECIVSIVECEFAPADDPEHEIWGVVVECSCGWGTDPVHACDMRAVQSIVRKGDYHQREADGEL